MTNNAAAENLGALRVLVCGVFLVFVLRDDFTAIGRLPTTIMHPPGVMEYVSWKFYDKLITPQGMVALKGALMLALGGAAAGVCHRWSMPTSLSLVVLYQGILRSFGHFNHDEMVGIFILLILTASPCSDALSVDARVGSRVLQPSINYRYPVWLMQCVMAWSYFSAGLMKLRLSGLEWFAADNLPVVSIQHSLDNLHDTQFKFAFYLPELGEINSALAVGAVIWELSFPLVLLGGRFRWFYVLSGITFHVITMLLMNITFWNQMAMYVIFVDWSRVVR